jgi:uncharacterized protein (DUF3084 family)
MTRKDRASIVLLIVLILISLSFAGGAFYLFQKERNEKLELQGKLEDINVNLEKTRVELDNSKKQISDFERRLKDAQAQIETLTSDLKQEKEAKQSALEQIGQLKSDLERQRADRDDLERRFTQAQDDFKKAQAQLKSLESKKMELEVKINDLEMKSQDLETKVQGIELGKIVVTPEATQPAQIATKPVSEKPAVGKRTSRKQEKAAPATTGLEGKVLVVNRDYNFAVINLGGKDGVDIGDVFSVYHNNKYLGDIKIEKVHDSMAAAGFLSADIKDKTSEGDKVVQKKK